jgi:CHAT domain-containing protein/Tfp pilus assembly protein PilF
MFYKHVFCYGLFGWLLFILPLNAFSQQPGYKTLFERAEKLSLIDNPSPAASTRVLQSYNKVISLLASNKKDPLLLLKTYIHAGTYLQVQGQLQKAITYYRTAFAFRNINPHVPDSAIFKPLVYCGNGYYQLDNLDSAAYFYDRAKFIAEKYPHIEEVERLYNTLGVIAYSTGNYSKSIIYYQKALSILESHKHVDNTLLVPYKSNLASAYRRLKKYDDALKIYKEILTYRIESDKINHNIGSLYLAMGKSADAIYYLKKVRYVDVRKLNDLGMAYLQQNDIAAASGYLQSAIALNTKNNGPRKNSDYGITLKYLGDIYLKQKQFAKSLASYQQAIGNFLADFHSDNIYTNPNNFNTVFNITELLDALLAKAEAFDSMHKQQGRQQDLEASLATYLSFYKLADHIERFYESDEARQVISERKYAARLHPITICLELYKLTNDKTFIEKAFFLDEENKANTLALNLKEESLRANSNVPAALFKEETGLKENITRASLRASGETDSLTLENIKRQINNFTIKLLSVQQKISHSMGAKQLAFDGQQVDIKELQNKIPPQTGLLSYHIGEKQMLCFIITKNSFDFVTAPLVQGYSAALKSFFENAQSQGGNNTKKMRALNQQLYEQWIHPLESYIDRKQSLMIIPDGELNYLPFEVLADADGDNLLNQHRITYNYSCTILQNSLATLAINNPAKLSMAPFTEWVSNTGKSTAALARLSSSKTEAEAIGGTTLLNKNATKQRFLKLANGYNIIHLATHAYASDKDPNRSFITFYPTNPDSVLSFQLFEPEIYNLKLNKAQLVVLSACESGAGELVKGEGVMSLSRAFSYAGCNNIITSMCKADDASTAYIAMRLHKYIAGGYGISEALQKAKLDYIEDDAISPVKKRPGYWANMRLIGNFEMPEAKHYALYITSGILFVGAVVLILKNRGLI